MSRQNFLDSGRNLHSSFSCCLNGFGERQRHREIEDFMEQITLRIAVVEDETLPPGGYLVQYLSRHTGCVPSVLTDFALLHHTGSSLHLFLHVNANPEKSSPEKSYFQ